MTERDLSAVGCLSARLGRVDDLPQESIDRRPRKTADAHDGLGGHPNAERLADRGLCNPVRADELASCLPQAPLTSVSGILAGTDEPLPGPLRHRHPVGHVVCGAGIAGHRVGCGPREVIVQDLRDLVLLAQANVS